MTTYQNTFDVNKMLALTLGLGSILNPVTASPLQKERYHKLPQSKYANFLLKSSGLSSSIAQNSFNELPVDVNFVNIVERETTDIEKIVGELRRFSALKDNWDHDGALAPIQSSLRQAISFVRLWEGEDIPLEPTVNANGRAGLCMNDEHGYADLEFIGDKRVAYYIERNEDKHKGVIYFDEKKLPNLFKDLLARKLHNEEVT